MLEQKNVQVKAGSSFQKICPFPVGYIYQSYTNTSPATIYGGTWTPITGRFLYCNNSTATGGSNTHTLTINEIPAHSHYTPEFAYQDSKGTSYKNTSTWGKNLNNNVKTNSVGGGAAHNNMPAYQSCYAWRRTA